MEDWYSLMAGGVNGRGEDVETGGGLAGKTGFGDIGGENGLEGGETGAIGRLLGKGFGLVIGGVGDLGKPGVDKGPVDGLVGGI